MRLKHEDLRAAMFDRALDEALVVTPLLDEAQITESTIDVRLGTEFLVLQRTLEPGLNPETYTRADAEAMYQRIFVPIGKRIWLHPGHFLLSSTLEYLRIPNDLTAYVLGRSSWGRVGLIVATAIVVQPGFVGSLTLELVNDGDSPICLYPGSRIAQLAVHRLDGPTERGYSSDGKYKAPIGPQPARLEREQDEIKQFGHVEAALNNRLCERRGP
jgi:dCTP deaminase